MRCRFACMPEVAKLSLKDCMFIQFVPVDGRGKARERDRGSSNALRLIKARFYFGINDLEEIPRVVHRLGHRNCEQIPQACYNARFSCRLLSGREKSRRRLHRNMDRHSPQLRSALQRRSVAERLFRYEFQERLRRFFRGCRILSGHQVAVHLHVGGPVRSL